MNKAANTTSTWVAGADGCRAGWFVVLRETPTGRLRRCVVPSFEALLTMPEAPVQLAIDVIIGLPDAPRSGGRLCDREARKLLGWPRSSSVFSPPAQAAIACVTYDEALAVNRRHSPDEVGISKQTFHLFPRLRAVEAHMTPAHQQRVREVHPELAFFAMNDEVPLCHSKHEDVGRRERAQLLHGYGFEDIEAAAETHAGRDVKRDDVLDAHAACWTALRLHQGAALRLPRGKPPCNARRLRMEIWR